MPQVLSKPQREALREQERGLEVHVRFRGEEAHMPLHHDPRQVQAAAATGQGVRSGFQYYMWYLKNKQKTIRAFFKKLRKCSNKNKSNCVFCF